MVAIAILSFPSKRIWAKSLTATDNSIVNNFADRSLKRSELQIKVAEDAREHVRSIYDKAKAQVDSAPRDDGTLLEKRKELQREVDVTKRTLAQQVKHRG